MTENDQQAIEDAVEQIGLSMAANTFPLFYVAQNVYDTSESVWSVWNARNSTDELTKISTGIDLVFAVVGWVPVVGAGVKRTFRLVNHRSEIYGPLLFDILRLVLQRAHCPTSPEELVDKLFDATGLRKLLTESREHIEKSWLYQEMPPSVQVTFNQALGYVETNLPYWLTQFVQRKLMHWRKKQPNSSSEGTVALRRETEKPGKVGVEAEDGHNRSNSAPAGGVVNSKLAVTDITNKVTGILGEHIADYYCYEHMKWGSGWCHHDDGKEGHWASKPGEDVLGKLNDGTKLNKLFEKDSRGQGIDGVWRATPDNNNGRRFAIVETKASRVARPRTDGAKPAVPRLGVATAVAGEVLPQPVELLGPVEGNGESSSTSTSGGKKSGGKKRGGNKVSSTSSSSGSDTQGSNTVSTAGVSVSVPAGGKIAQMSDTWVYQNLPAAVGRELADTIRLEKYARHILYVPFYLPSAIEHVAALTEGRQHDHGNHHIPLHYTEAEVAKAVDEKQARLNRKYERT